MLLWVIFLQYFKIIILIFQISTWLNYSLQSVPGSSSPLITKNSFFLVEALTGLLIVVLIDIVLVNAFSFIYIMCLLKFLPILLGRLFKFLYIFWI